MRLQQVILNLLSNALKFTPRKGAVKISAYRVDDMLTISVRDTGCGIPEGDQAKLFQLFGTIEDTRSRINLKGIGLGLVISKMIVE